MGGVQTPMASATKPPCVKRSRRWRRGFVIGLTLIALGILGVPLSVEVVARFSDYPVVHVPMPAPSTVVLDRNGRSLSAFTADNGRWFVPMSAAEHGRWLPLAVQAVEDARFRQHSGIDWIATYTALVQNIIAGRVVRGSSTITMQVERLRHPRPRTVASKLVEAVRARQIEFAHSKDDILHEWLERASYGGNLVGVGAASWRWFGVPPESLSLAQAALLAGLPQNPERLRPDRHPAQARARRDVVLRRMHATNVIDAKQLSAALQEPAVLVSGVWTQDEDLAALPIFADLSAKQQGLIATTLDATTQRSAARLLDEQLARLAGSGVDAGAVAVLDVESGAWLALVSRGSQRWLDHTLVARSSGSVLKPFIYAGAFARGIATPSSVLADDTVGWRGYLPKNYDKEWRGQCSAAEALRDSRNVPAMQLLEQQGLSYAAGLMEAFGLPRLSQQAQRTGLTLAIGGAEVDVRSLAQAYAGLAREGRRLNARLAAKKQDFDDVPVLDAAACRQVLSCLVNRERTMRVCPSAAVLEPAWKTGTSSGHRDAWCAAVTPRRCVVAWFGTTRGAGSPVLVGVDAAAPITLALLAATDPGGATWSPVADGEPTPLAAPILSSPLVITWPQAGSELLILGLSQSSRVALTCRGGGSGPRWWFINGAPLTSVASGEPAWWTPASGRHAVRVVDQHGQSAEVDIMVR